MLLFAAVRMVGPGPKLPSWNVRDIRANKNRLGFSFEARDLMTTDPEADPIPIAECVFTGAAILFKDKAAYRSTGIDFGYAALS
jgi:hypothetical protein